MSDVSCLRGTLLFPNPLPATAVSEAEREVRRLLTASDSENTARARAILLSTAERGAEWFFLMGICSQRYGYMTDARAQMGRACDLSAASDGEAVAEYRAAYGRVACSADMEPDAEVGSDEKKRRLCAGADCWDACYCCDGCDCCSDCFGGRCDCGDLCHCCDDGCSCDGCCDCN